MTPVVVSSRLNVNATYLFCAKQGLDSLPCCSETYKWAWFRRYCMAARVARALVGRTELPQPFCLEVRKE